MILGYLGGFSGIATVLKREDKRVRVGQRRDERTEAGARVTHST